MIRILDKFVADKIAAGEVIERPLSVVKEIVENSIDAGATSIVVEIKNGGKSYIRVTDNGCGINSEEVLLAFMRHATSKIETDKDLERIETLGFRGEALASIAAVSRTELVTKEPDKKLGKKVIMAGGVVVENIDTGCPDGTTIIVTDLFFNTPARLKFMKSDKAESSVIIDFISKMALAYPNIKFRLINNGTILFATNGKGDNKSNILTIYGRDIETGLVPVNYENGYAKLSGFVSSPGISRTSRKYQIFFVNGRNVNSRVIEEGVNSAYSDRLFEGRYPSAFLFLEIEPDKLDVNVHPNKKEVKFDDNSFISAIVRNAVLDAIATKEAVPEIKAANLFAHKDAVKEKTASRETEQISFKSQSNVESSKTTMNVTGGDINWNKETQVNIKKLLSALREEDESLNEQKETLPLKESFSTHSIISEPLPEYSSKPLQKSEETLNKPFDFAELTVRGSVFNTYIVLTDNTNMYLIDQHAAHERIFFERLMKSWQDTEKVSQVILVPIILNVPYDIKENLSENMKSLSDMGFEIEEFGPKSYIIKAVPMFMQLSEAEDFLNYFADNVSESTSLIDRKQLEKIAMNACKSAVKGGDVLAREEIDELISSLAACENPYSCPHGRPTFIKMSKYEIEKMFKRV